LSKREIDVFKLLAGGASNKKISEELFILLSTVKFHTSNIYVKFNVAKRKDVIDLTQN